MPPKLTDGHLDDLATVLIPRLKRLADTETAAGRSSGAVYCSKPKCWRLGTWTLWGFTYSEDETAAEAFEIPVCKTHWTEAWHSWKAGTLREVGGQAILSLSRRGKEPGNGVENTMPQSVRKRTGDQD
jgi:hypothetical protein